MEKWETAIDVLLLVVIFAIMLSVLARVWDIVLR